MTHRPVPDDEYAPDESRTIRPHAGETLEDTRNWPGLVLLGIGIIAAALTLTAAGYGFMGWMTIGIVATVLCLGIGATLVILEHRRVKKLQGRDLLDPGGH
ncbi:hypothetical protein [Nocardia sp. NPDC050406]|uniref:hypothetical protein n=1 Tax=Nocardia sp. NPDC050406 TaxID=3364318 RepID=UPI0037A71798